MSDGSPSVEKVAELAKEIRVGMLTTIDDAGHYVSRPMAQQEVEFDGDLWFFAERDSRKVAHITREPGGRPHADLQRHVDLISGRAEIVDDRRRRTSSGTGGSRPGCHRAPTIRASS